jgi:cell division protein FtsI (penicillin-binding protein 3)
MKKDPSLSRRVYVLAAVILLWGSAIGARLYFLHVVRSADYRQRAERQQQRTFEVTPPRGIIYDRHKNELAISIKVDSVFAVAEEIDHPEETARTLSKVLGLSKQNLLDKFQTQRSFVWIKRKLSATESLAIQRAKLRGIYTQKEDRRFYPKRELAAHVMGYVNVDEEGMGGLEYRYNGSVRGETGRAVIMSDARGRSFNSIEQPALPGANLITTIDENIQYVLEKEVAAAAARTHPKGISVIAMSPSTGEIFGMANYPTFNPNEYSKYGSEARINRGVSETYEPGSTFKIVTAASAIEEGVASPSDVIDCQMGSITLFGRLIHDHARFGLLTVKQIMEKSSDVGAIKLGLRVGDERFASYIDRLGFGKLTSIDLPAEERGLTKPASRWTKSSIGSIAMGQEIGVTPLQIVRVVSAVANGGILYRPYVVKAIEDSKGNVLRETAPQGERAISADTAAKLQDMLEVVVTEGTATAGKLEGYTAAGKTGTAQKIDETGHYSRTKFVASFAGFAPASNPVVAIIVVIDEPSGQHMGGEVAAPVFKKVAEPILRYMSVPPDAPSYAPQYTVKQERRPEPEPVVKPDTSSPAVFAPKYIVAGFSPRSVDTADSGAEFGEIVVPDFSGKSLREVTQDCLKAGLRLQSMGSGAAIQQLPPPGTTVSAGARIKVRFSTRLSQR